MKTRIRIVWGTQKDKAAQWRLGLFSRYARVAGYPDSGLAVSFRGVLLWGLALLLMGYLAGTTALYLWLDTRGQNFVTYTDAVLFPLRWDEIREKRGQGYIADGLDDLRAQRWSEGVMKLRVGLVRYPKDLRARLALAQIYLLSHRRDQAMKILQEGLGKGAYYPGKKYVESFFSIVAQGEEFNLIVETCNRYLGPEGGGAARHDRQWLLLQKAVTLQKMNRDAEAVALVDDEGPEAPAALLEQKFLALLALKKTDEAVDHLAKWRLRAGKDPQVLKLQARAFREAGRLDSMEQVLEELRQLNPTEPLPYIIRVEQRALAGDTDSAGEALDNFILRFGGSPDIMKNAVETLAEGGHLALVNRLVDASLERGFPKRVFYLAQVHAAVQAGDWQAATSSFDRVKEFSPVSGQHAERLWRDWMEALLAATVNSASPNQGTLVEFMRGRLIPLVIHRRTIEAMVRSGHPETAYKIAVFAGRFYPNSRSLEMIRTELEQKLATERETVDATEVGPQRAAPLVQSVFFAELEGAIERKEWSGAMELIRSALLGKPAWLPNREAELLAKKMEASRELNDTLEMLGAAKMLIDGSAERSQMVVDYATRLHATGDRNNAIALLREIQRKVKFLPAEDLMQEWGGLQPEPATRPAPTVPGRAPQTAPRRQSQLIEAESLEQVDAAFANKNWADVHEMVREILRAKPVWLSGREGELLVKKMMANREMGDLLEMLSATNMLLDGSNQRAQIVLDYASRLHDQGDRDTAMALARAVQRKNKAFPPLTRLLNSWSAQAAAEAEAAPGK